VPAPVPAPVESVPVPPEPKTEIMPPPEPPPTPPLLIPNQRTIELEISLDIRKALETQQLSSMSAMAIVRKGIELLDHYTSLKGNEKKQMLIRVLEHISAGNDGILGTDDDILPQGTVKAIRAILDQSLIEDIVETLIGISKGDVSVEKIIDIGTQLKETSTCLFNCFSKSKKKVASA
jgi:hypothetical protein